jgi:hypothetical protein
VSAGLIGAGYLAMHNPMAAGAAAGGEAGMLPHPKASRPNLARVGVVKSRHRPDPTESAPQVVVAPAAGVAPPDGDQGDDGCGWKPDDHLVGSCAGSGPKLTEESRKITTAAGCRALCCSMPAEHSDPSKRCISWQYRADTGCRVGGDVRCVPLHTVSPYRSFPLLQTTTTTSTTTTATTTAAATAHVSPVLTRHHNQSTEAFLMFTLLPLSPRLARHSQHWDGEGRAFCVV